MAANEQNLSSGDTKEFLAQIQMLCRPTSKAVERKALGARDGLDDVQVVV